MSHEPPDLKELERAVAADRAGERGPLAWLRSRSRAFRMGLVALLVALDGLFFHQVMLRRDFDTYPRARFILTVGVFALLVLLAAWQSLRPLHLPPAPAWLTRALVGAALVVPVIVAVAPGLPGAGADSGFPYLKVAWYCFTTGVGQGLFAVLLLKALDRGGRVAGVEALLVALAGGVLGQIGLTFECPYNFPLHLLTGHATVPVGLLLGTLLMRRLAR